jgi:hypothetical protein
MTVDHETSGRTMASRPGWASELASAMAEIQHLLDQVSTGQEAHRDLIGLRLDDQAAKLRELLPGLVDQAVGKTLTSVQASQDRLRVDLDKHLRELAAVQAEMERLARAIRARATQRTNKAARQAIEGVASQRAEAERRERRRGEQWRAGAVAILALYVVVQVAGLSAGWIALSWDPAIVLQHGSLGLAVGVLFGFCKLESRRHFRDARNAEEFRTRLGVAGDRIAGVATPDDQQLSAEEILRLVFGLGPVQGDRRSPLREGHEST